MMTDIVKNIQTYVINAKHLDKHREEFGSLRTLKETQVCYSGVRITHQDLWRNFGLFLLPNFGEKLAKFGKNPLNFH